MSSLSHYVLKIQHDHGVTNIATVASSEAAAILIVMNAEGCPRSAIVAVTKGGAV